MENIAKQQRDPVIKSNQIYMIQFINFEFEIQQKMNKIQCRNCLSNKRQFYVYTSCKHFLCLQCTFCLTNFQKNSIRCCYQYTPISEQLLPILRKEAMLRINTTQSQIKYLDLLQQQKTLKRQSAQKNRNYFLKDSIKQENQHKKQAKYYKESNNQHKKHQSLKPYKTKSIYMNKIAENKSFQKNSFDQKIEKQVKQFQQQSIDIQAQKQKIHQCFKEYHQQLELCQIQTLKRLCNLSNCMNQEGNLRQHNNKQLNDMIKAQSPQKQNISTVYHYPATSWKKHSKFQDRMTSKLNHFRNVLQEKLLKHYI